MATDVVTEGLPDHKYYVIKCQQLLRLGQDIAIATVHRIITVLSPTGYHQKRHTKTQWQMAFQDGQRCPGESRVLGSVEGECLALCMAVVIFITWCCRASLSVLPHQHKLHCLQIVVQASNPVPLLLSPFFLPLYNIIKYYNISLLYGNSVRGRSGLY